MDAGPVDPFVDDAAVVVAPVPEVGDRRSALPPAPCELADDVAVAVDDLDVTRSGRRRPKRIDAPSVAQSQVGANVLSTTGATIGLRVSLSFSVTTKAAEVATSSAATSSAGARRALIAGAGSGCRRGPQPPHGDCKNSVRGPPAERPQPGAQAHWTGGTSEPNRSMRRRLLFSFAARARPRRGRGRRRARDALVAAGHARDRGDRRDGRRPDDSARDDGPTEATEAEAAQAEATEPEPEPDSRCWTMFGGDARR